MRMTLQHAAHQPVTAGAVAAAAAVATAAGATAAATKLQPQHTDWKAFVNPLT
jgi:hypothetical protein